MTYHERDSDLSIVHRGQIVMVRWLGWINGTFTCIWERKRGTDVWLVYFIQLWWNPQSLTPGLNSLGLNSHYVAQNEGETIPSSSMFISFERFRRIVFVRIYIVCFLLSILLTDPFKNSRCCLSELLYTSTLHTSSPDSSHSLNFSLVTLLDCLSVYKNTAIERGKWVESVNSLSFCVSHSAWAEVHLELLLACSYAMENEEFSCFDVCLFIIFNMLNKVRVDKGFTHSSEWIY